MEFWGYPFTAKCYVLFQSKIISKELSHKFGTAPFLHMKFSNKKCIGILLAFLFAGNVMNASGLMQPADTSRKPWKIGKQEFIKQYGNDSSTALLIEYWYQKHELAYLALAGGGLGVTIFGGLFGPPTFGTSQNIRPVANFAPLLFYFGTIPSLVVLLFGYFRLRRYSRKKLYHLLQSRNPPGKRLAKKLKAFAMQRL